MVYQSTSCPSLNVWQVGWFQYLTLGWPNHRPHLCLLSWKVYESFVKGLCRGLVCFRLTKSYHRTHLCLFKYQVYEEIVKGLCYPKVSIIIAHSTVNHIGGLLFVIDILLCYLFRLQLNQNHTASCSHGYICE